jgi:uncharacterized protein (DUF1697 family)
MSRYFAFLRAINVGGHSVKMDALRQQFEALGFTHVETFIASGNVIFESPAQDTRALEKQIEAGLRSSLGYAVATFVRTPAELAGIARCQPFQPGELEAAMALNIAFLADPLDAAGQQKLLTLRTDIDDFRTHQREIYWLCRKRQSESTFSNVVFEKVVGRQTTFRGVNTVRKMAAKYAESAD